MPRARASRGVSCARRMPALIAPPIAGPGRYAHFNARTLVVPPPLATDSPLRGHVAHAPEPRSPPERGLFFSVSMAALSLHGTHGWHVRHDLAGAGARRHIPPVDVDPPRSSSLGFGSCDTGSAPNPPPSAPAQPADGALSSLVPICCHWIRASVLSSGSTLCEWGLFFGSRSGCCGDCMAALPNRHLSPPTRWPIVTSNRSRLPPLRPPLLVIRFGG